MNENCPAETSNLTNPSKLFRDLSGFTTDPTTNTREFFYFDHLPPDTKAKQLAASRRMFDLGLTPSDGTTFLSLPLPNTTTTTPPHPQPNTPNHTPTRPLAAQPPNPNANHPITPPNNDLPPTDMSITTDYSRDLLANNDDLASQTSNHLNMQSHAQPLNPHHHHKRTRDAASLSTSSTSDNPSHSYVQFNTPLQSTKINIFSTLASALTNASIPPDSISTTIQFWAFPSTRIIDEKLAFITILDPTLTPTRGGNHKKNY
jgi:hypothetical protein